MAVTNTPDTREKLPICERLRDYMVREKPLRDEAADTIEALYEALATIDCIVLEQRCERGTPWDLACVTIAEKVREHAATALTLARDGGQP